MFLIWKPFMSEYAIRIDVQIIKSHQRAPLGYRRVFVGRWPMEHPESAAECQSNGDFDPNQCDIEQFFDRTPFSI
jgi:hypothetical protein